jgi:hypothetical protein
MKKIIICLTTLLSINYVNAQNQTEKGNFAIGGNINYNQKNYNNTGNEYIYSNIIRENTFKINPNIGYFVKKNLEIGVDVFYDYNQQKYKINNFETVQPVNSFVPESTEMLTITSTFGLGAYLNYYVPIIEKLSFSLNNSISFANGKIEKQYSNNVYTPQSGKINGFGLSISPGLIYFISPKLSFQTKFADLHYNNFKSTFDNSNNSIKLDDFGIGTDLSSLLLGINYYIE